QERRQLLRLFPGLREQGRKARPRGGAGRMCGIRGRRRLRLPGDRGLRVRVQHLRARPVRPLAAMTLPPRVVLQLPDWVHQAVAAGDACPSDADKVSLAISLAARNVAEGTGGPFGAVLFGPDDRVVAAGVNVVLPQSTSLAHAENMAYMLAQQAL